MMKQFYSTEELEALIGISRNTLRKWRWEGKGPKFVKLGARVAYRLEDIEAYTGSRVCSSTSTPLDTNYAPA